MTAKGGAPYFRFFLLASSALAVEAGVSSFMDKSGMSDAGDFSVMVGNIGGCGRVGAGVGPASVFERCFALRRASMLGVETVTGAFFGFWKVNRA